MPSVDSTLNVAGADWFTWWTLPRRDSSNADLLAVKGVDFCNDSNGKNHHTSKFNLMTRAADRCLVVRRGQAFKLELLLNRPYDASGDVVSFVFHVSDVEKRGPSDDAIAAVPLLDMASEIPGSWTAVYQDQKESRLVVAITPSADCIVAAWKLEIDTKLKSGTRSLTYVHPLPIYVLFNPWCSKDSVFMSDESHREEYVQEASGLIYRGTDAQQSGMVWYYAQYEKDILDCALYLVRQVGKVKGCARSDPIRTVRALSAAVNSPNDSGVVIGNWGSNFPGGKNPLDWVGSLAILQKYYAKKQSVGYGQCWVFAGVLTTICRALGIPCRPVSGFNAAHDSQGSLTIDVVLDEDGNEVKPRSDNDIPRDSVWNYHVWNEVWMERPDLGAEYGGWQVIDATPQEPSGDLYRCGPASIRAVRNAEIQKPYDAGYVFAEVNADRVFWKYSGKNQPLKLLGQDIAIIGKCISTKAVGKREREDLTDSYKYPEGTREERATMERALRLASDLYARYYLNDAFNVVFNFELRHDINIGQDFTVILHMNNRSLEHKHQVQGVLRVDTVTYTGMVVEMVKHQEFVATLGPEDDGQVTMTVTFDEYSTRLVDQASFKISCLAKIVDTNSDVYAQEIFRVRNPDIEMTVDNEPVVGQELTVTLELKNPLPTPLIHGKFYIQVSGLDEQLKIKLDESVPPGQLATAQFKLTPAEEGKLQISAKFKSEEIRGVDGFLAITVALPDAYNSETNELPSYTLR